MKEETVKQLQKISTPKVFSKDEYICYEGEPGNEMYIILRGSVGIYITNAMGTPVEVSVMHAGGFFGEMAIFDKLPRSASCVALEDVICVAITRKNLMQFIGECPDMAEKILENMSGRIRKLNNDLYKNSRPTTDKKLSKFEMPAEYSFSHMVKPPYQEARYFAQDEHKCPICGKMITTTKMKRHLMQVRSVDRDCRVNYLHCDPLWQEILFCPHCYYSNYRLNFFDINEACVKQVRKLLREEHAPVVEDVVVKRTEFDELVLRYLQAIHINEAINGADNVLIGTLWLYLYWLAKDSGDVKFVDYCANHAIEKLQAAIDEKQIAEVNNRYSIALSLGNLFAYKKMERQAIKYTKMAQDSPEDNVRGHAEALLQTLKGE